MTVVQKSVQGFGLSGNVKNQSPPGLLNNDSGLAFAVNLLFLRCLNCSHAN